MSGLEHWNAAHTAEREKDWRTAERHYEEARAAFAKESCPASAAICLAGAMEMRIKQGK